MTFQNGYCVNCDSPINTGILCPKCTPCNLTLPTAVANLHEGQDGFTEKFAIFKADGQIYIVGSAVVVPEYGGYKTARVRKTGSIYKVDSQTVDQDDIWEGWPQLNEESLFFPVEFI